MEETIKVRALHKFMTSAGKLIDKDTIFQAEDNEETKLWLRRQLVEIVLEKSTKPRKKKN